MVRIISKEEEREDPRRDSSIYLRVQNTVVFPHFYKNYSASSNSTRITRFLRIQCIPTRTTVFPHAIQQVFQSSRAILHTELILLQEFSKKYYNYKAHPVQAPSSNCSPCIQAFYTAESSHKAPYSIPGPYSTSRLPVILGSRNSILHGSQHPRSPYSSSQAHSNRILPGEIGFFPKGLSIVYPIQY